MEKKKYIKPEIEVEFFESEVLMFSGSLNDEEASSKGDQLSNSYRPGRRGEWGNLWAPGEE